MKYTALLLLLMGASYLLPTVEMPDRAAQDTDVEASEDAAALDTGDVEVADAAATGTGDAEASEGTVALATGDVEAPAAPAGPEAESVAEIALASFNGPTRVDRPAELTAPAAEISPLRPLARPDEVQRRAAEPVALAEFAEPDTTFRPSDFGRVGLQLASLAASARDALTEIRSDADASAAEPALALGKVDPALAAAADRAKAASEQSPVAAGDDAAVLVAVDEDDGDAALAAAPAVEIAQAPAESDEAADTTAAEVAEAGAVEAPAAEEVAEADPFASAPPEKLRAVSAKRLNMRAGPSTRYPVITALENGERTLLIGGRRGNWLQVRAENSDAEGWVFRRYLRPAG